MIIIEGPCARAEGPWRESVAVAVAVAEIGDLSVVVSGLIDAATAPRACRGRGRNNVFRKGRSTANCVGSLKLVGGFGDSQGCGAGS